MDAHPKRRSLRMPGYDYSKAGAYFISICTKDRKCLFGEIADQEMVLNEPGRMINTVWNELVQRFSRIELIQQTIMPNHIHGIIAIVGVPLVGTRKTIGALPERADTRPAPTAVGLGDIVGTFKSITTLEYIHGVRQYGWTSFPGKLWQRNYYEHIIRSENEMNRIREYILNNPAQWDMDHENPFAKNGDKRSQPY